MGGGGRGGAERTPPWANRDARCRGGATRLVRTKRSLLLATRGAGLYSGDGDRDRARGGGGRHSDGLLEPEAAAWRPEPEAVARRPEPEAAVSRPEPEAGSAGGLRRARRRSWRRRRPPCATWTPRSRRPPFCRRAAGCSSGTAGGKRAPVSAAPLRTALPRRRPGTGRGNNAAYRRAHGDTRRGTEGPIATSPGPIERPIETSRGLIGTRRGTQGPIETRGGARRAP